MEVAQVVINPTARRGEILVAQSIHEAFFVPVLCQVYGDDFALVRRVGSSKKVPIHVYDIDGDAHFAFSYRTRNRRCGRRAQIIRELCGVGCRNYMAHHVDLAVGDFLYLEWAAGAPAAVQLNISLNDPRPVPDPVPDPVPQTSSSESDGEVWSPERGAVVALKMLAQENTDGAVDVDSSSESEDTVPKEHSSVVIASLNSYKEALANNNDSKIAEVESFLKTIEDEKIDLERKVATLSEELSDEKDRVRRIIADFDNFRKRTETERLSLVSNAQGEIVESLLPVLDNFERAKAQIKIETEGEEKISNSYQSIYKQFVEILGSLGVVPVETVGKPFDPMLHEAIMREDSTEYEDGVVIEEYRKGFQLGDTLLRQSMVKVSAGPGPTKPDSGQSHDQEEDNGNNREGS